MSALNLSDEAALAELALWRWHGGKPQCARCGDVLPYKIHRGRYGFFRCSLCRHEFTVFSETPLSFAKGPPQLYAAALRAFAAPPINALAFSRMAAVQYRTAWRLAAIIKSSGYGEGIGNTYTLSSTPRTIPCAA